MTPGFRNIVIDGAELWAYVGADRIEGLEALAGIPTKATIDGSEYLVQVTRVSGASFIADILGPAPVQGPVESASVEPVSEEPHAE